MLSINIYVKFEDAAKRVGLLQRYLSIGEDKLSGAVQGASPEEKKASPLFSFVSGGSETLW